MSNVPLIGIGQLAEAIPALPDQVIFPSWSQENWLTAYGQYGSVVGNRFNGVSININQPYIHLGVTQFAIAEQHRQWSLTILSLEDNIRKLTTEMQELKEEIGRLCRVRTFVVPLTTLAPAPFQVTQHIPVTIEGDGEEFTATFTEANISASGETEADAIANFKDSLVSSFELLERKNPAELGPLPTRQWSILTSAVKRIE